METIEAKDLRSIAAEVAASGKAVELPDEGAVMVPLAEWSRIRRIEAMQAAAALGRRHRLDDVDTAELIRQGRASWAREILGDLDRD